MIGQIGLGESGGVSRYSPDQAVPPQIHSVGDNQALSEVSSDSRPPQENREAWLPHPDKSHTRIGSPPLDAPPKI